jgi:hypothetical protein
LFEKVRYIDMKSYDDIYKTIDGWLYVKGHNLLDNIKQWEVMYTNRSDSDIEDKMDKFYSYIMKHVVAGWKDTMSNPNTYN